MDLSFHHTGSCRHFEYATRRGAPMRPCHYPMHAGVIDRGSDLVVFDPGYAPRIVEATAPFPERLYRWFTPLALESGSPLGAWLESRGERAAVSHVILSHFHADHVAGLMDFPSSRIVCSRAGWQHFRSLGRFGSVRAGYLASLAPVDFEERALFVEDLPYRRLPADLSPFEHGWDLFNDGSLCLIALPGHATGHIGALFQARDGGFEFLIADAAWSVPALLANDPPPWLTLRLLGSAGDYLETWSRLQALHRSRSDIRMRACHCSHSTGADSA